MWFQIDLARPIRLTAMTVQPGVGPDWPRKLQVSATSDRKHWRNVYTGQASATQPAFAYLGSSRQAAAITSVRLTLRETSDAAPWKITEIWLQGPLKQR